jgi:CubicO group peptidase (beta-lactamase class C family)
MKIVRLPGISASLAAVILLTFSLSVSHGQQPAAPVVNMTPVQPESVGFSSQRLERLHAVFQDEITNKQLSGAVTILARHGKVVDYRTFGTRDMATGAPMTKDTIFRDYSMTKPTTGVAMMILYEEGKWLPSDPISKFIPEFAHLKVFNGFDSTGKMILAEPEHAPTMRELMTHTAGFTYGTADTPVDRMYNELKPGTGNVKNLQEMIDKLAKIPLLYQPGHGWTYSMSMDIQGYIVEKLTGQSLPDFDRDHIFAPLGMTDAAFYVPADKRARFAAGYHEEKGELVAEPTANGIPSDYDAQPAAPSGGGGLLSTAEDYFRFASMLGGLGQLDKTRILAPSSVKLMSSNHLPAELLNGHFGIGLSIMRPGFGYGYDCAVVYDPPEANMPDGKGTFFWDGAAGTFFWVDPTNDIVFVAMIQRRTSPDNHPLEYRTHALVNQALVDPSK